MQKISTFILIGILLVAAFFRLWQLNTLPPGLHPDEAANGLDIIRMIDNHDFRVFYNTNGPREALFFYLQGIFVAFGVFFPIPGLGFTQLALRLAPAILGILTVFGLYLLVKQWLGKNAALIASFLLAVSSWHVQFSRNGFRAIMVPFILVFLFYFLTKALREKRPIYFVATGVFFALGFYTYLSYLMIVPIAFFFLIYLLLFYRSQLWVFLKENWRNIVLGIAAAILIYLPMGLYFAKHPGDFLARSAGTSILNPELGSPIQLLLENTAKALFMFTNAGDENYRHNLGGSPMLDPMVGIFSAVGIFIALLRIKKPEYFFLLLWFGFMLAPTILTGEGIPHALRAVGTIPVMYIFAVLAIQPLHRYLHKKIPARKIANVFLIFILIFSAAYGYMKYFVVWAKDPATYRAYDADIASMAAFLNTIPKDIQKYALILGYSNHSLAFLTHDHKDHRIQGLYGISGNYYVIDHAENLNKIAILPSTKYIFVIQETLSKEARPILENRFPDGQFAAKDGFFYYSNAISN
ncbi:MAG: glycosyltransferase family 39 protein [Candidatus Wildermuthbacteria bacterium]|nr:glycosyltransferase family 39 protein [Candidatus Wildermuthbacteria bacterium]